MGGLRHRAALVALSALAGVGGWTGCGDGPTGVVVLVDTDLSVPGALDGVRVEARGAAVSEATVDLAGASDLPVRVTLVPGDPDVTRFSLVVEGLRGVTPVARYDATVDFAHGALKVLRVSLAAACCEGCAGGVVGRGRPRSRSARAARGR